MNKSKAILLLTLTAILLATAACSSHKNTAKSRFWQAFTAKYNTYYNGTLAYIDGSLAKEQGNKDNYTEIIPLYTVGNKSSRSLGSGNFDTAIEKCQKAIKLHSISKRPEWTKNRRKTPKDIEWLSRREYNPMLWKAWMLMGRSQFHKGAFDEAAATFSYMSRLYQTQPAIYGKARAWLAKCYIQQEWLYDAEDVIRNMSRDSIDWHAAKEWDYTYADYYIHAGDYEKAIPYLRKVIKHEMRKKQRARECFLLGQLEAALGHRDLAYKAYKKVVRLNPPYELDFNARIAMTEVMAAGRSKQTISRLKRMAANDNNKEFLDQVYYAMGNVYLLDNDTAKAISAYEKGNEKSTRSGVEKGVLLLKLGDLYWQKEKFGDAQRCYGAAIGMLDKERKDYEQLSRRSQILDELAPYTDAIHLQDSLLALADMSEADRNAAIDRVIEALKKKEKEEKKAKLEEISQQTQARNGALGNRNQQQQRTNPAANQQQRGEWYFYNQLAVSQGKTTFQKQWGKRENEDNWQRSNKTVVGDLSFGDNPQDQVTDSLYAAMEAAEDSLATVQDSAQNDPHKREYYLKQIPFEEEQKAECHAIISDGLYHSGIIFKDKLDNLRLSEKQFDRLTYNYPEFEKMDEVYYHLFLLHSRKGDTAKAESYIDLLKQQFPESQWTTILTDPYYVENSKFGEHIEDSLYTATYSAFKADRYQEVFSNTTLSETRFPMGANRDKFVFILGLSRLNANDADGCIEDMNFVVKNFPSSRISEMAGMIVNGVKAGRQLHGGKFDLEDVWSRRAAVLSDSDSIAARTFTPDRNKEFLFILTYHPDSLNENQLLFEMARFNFTTFIVRNFDIQIEDADGIHLMQVSGFRFFDEAHQYASEVHKQANILRRMKKARTIIISRENLELLGRQYSYDDYEEFYSKHFAPLKINDDNLLSEPTEIGYEREPDMKSALPASTDGNAAEGDDGYSLDDGNGGAANNDDNGYDIPSEDAPEPAAPDNGEINDIIDIPATVPSGNSTTTPQPTDDGGISLPTEDDGGISLPTEDNGGISLPTEDDGGISLPTEDDGGISLPTEDDGGISLPTEDDGGISLPTEDDGGISLPENGGMTLPDNPGTGNSSSIDDDEYILQVQKKKNDPAKAKTDTQSRLLNQGEQHAVELPSTGTTTRKPVESNKKRSQDTKRKPVVIKQDIGTVKPVTKKEQPQQPNNPQKEDTGIYFDDGFGEDVTPTPNTKKKKNEKELEEFDLEDEYYDLDGF